jgi:hypothetical protein
MVSDTVDEGRQHRLNGAPQFVDRVPVDPRRWLDKAVRCNVEGLVLSLYGAWLDLAGRFSPDGEPGHSALASWSDFPKPAEQGRRKVVLPHTAHGESVPSAVPENP